MAYLQLIEIYLAYKLKQNTVAYDQLWDDKLLSRLFVSLFKTMIRYFSGFDLTFEHPVYFILAENTQQQDLY